MKVVLSAEDVSKIMLFALQQSLFLFDEVVTVSYIYISLYNPKNCSELADSSSLGIISPDEDWFAEQCLHVLLIKNPDLASACTLDPDLVGYTWNGADAAYPANYVLHRSTKAQKDYMNSCFGGQCVKKIKLSQSVFGQWIKECAGM